MKFLLTVVAFLCTIAVCAAEPKVSGVTVYKGNVLLLSDKEIAKEDGVTMDTHDTSFMNNLFSTVAPSNSSPVAPQPGGLFCVVSFDNDTTIKIRMTSNVVVAKRIDKGRENFVFYAPRNPDSLTEMTKLLVKYKR